MFKPVPNAFIGQALMPQLPFADAPQFAGYQAVSSITALVRDFARLGEIIDTASRAGAVVTTGYQFRLRDERALRNKLLQETGHEAREKADTLAGALDKRIRRSALGFRRLRNIPGPPAQQWLPPGKRCADTAVGSETAVDTRTTDLSGPRQCNLQIRRSYY